MAGRPWSDRGGHDWPARFRGDADLRDELEYCERAGIPHSIFLGRLWPDPDDPYAPQWAEDDQDKAVSYLRWKAQCCHGCGAHPSEWAYLEDGTIDEQDPPYEVRRTSCLGCQMTGDARKDIPADRVMAVRAHLVPRKRDADKSEDEMQDEFEEWAAAGGGW